VYKRQALCHIPMLLANYCERVSDEEFV